MLIGGHREVINKAQIGDGLCGRGGMELFYPPLFICHSLYLFIIVRSILWVVSGIINCNLHSKGKERKEEKRGKGKKEKRTVKSMAEKRALPEQKRFVLVVFLSNPKFGSYHLLRL
jgi:hypothetical protein